MSLARLKANFLRTACLREMSWVVEKYLDYYAWKLFDILDKISSDEKASSEASKAKLLTNRLDVTVNQKLQVMADLNDSRKWNCRVR